MPRLITLQDEDSALVFRDEKGHEMYLPPSPQGKQPSGGTKWTMLMGFMASPQADEDPEFKVLVEMLQQRFIAMLKEQNEILVGFFKGDNEPGDGDA